MINKDILRIAMKQSAEDIRWSNIRSVRNAVKSGFIPAWVEMTAKPSHIVDDMNKTDGEKGKC